MCPHASEEAHSGSESLTRCADPELLAKAELTAVGSGGWKESFTRRSHQLISCVRTVEGMGPLKDCCHQGNRKKAKPRSYTELGA